MAKKSNKSRSKKNPRIAAEKFVERIKVNQEEIGKALEHFRRVHSHAHGSNASQIQVSLPLGLGDKIFKWRTKIKVSIPGLAKQIGVSNNFLNLIEQNKPVRYSELDRASKGFSLPIKSDLNEDEVSEEGIEEKWVSTETERINLIIVGLSENLQNLISIIKTDNQLNSSDEILNPVQKAQLIAMLEATLIELKAPNFSVNKSKGFLDFMKRIGKKAAEKEATERVRGAFDGVVDGTEKLVNEAGSVDGPSDIMNLFM